jgi:hypothetical protein
LETTEAWEREGIAEAQMGPMVGAVDATFLQRMMLVCMDLEGIQLNKLNTCCIKEKGQTGTV